MDSIPMKERDTVIDVESCVSMSKEVGTACKNVDEKVNGEISVSLPSNLKNVDEFSPQLGKNNKREKRKSTSAKKPPRPPRGLSLDAADQKMIKEISELAMIKRARIERMKALKKMKAAKASSVSTSSNGNLIAMLFTVIFCIVVIFQGCHSPRNTSATPTPASLESNVLLPEGNILVAQEQQNQSSIGVPITSIKSPSLTELVPTPDSNDEAKKAIH